MSRLRTGNRRRLRGLRERQLANAMGRAAKAMAHTAWRMGALVAAVRKLNGLGAETTIRLTMADPSGAQAGRPPIVVRYGKGGRHVG